MTNSERARKMTEVIENRIRKTNEAAGISDVKFINLDKLLLQMLNEAVKEVREDMLRLLSSTDETVALHSEFTARYRGI